MNCHNAFTVPARYSASYSRHSCARGTSAPPQPFHIGLGDTDK